jgi:hypothetical protein
MQSMAILSNLYNFSYIQNLLLAGLTNVIGKSSALPSGIFDDLCRLLLGYRHLEVDWSAFTLQILKDFRALRLVRS